MFETTPTSCKRGKTKLTNKTATKAQSSKVPLFGIIFGALAIALVLAIVLTGEEPLGGANFGTPVVTGVALPPIGTPGTSDSDPAIGATMPEVAGQNFNGDTVNLSNDGRAKAILFVSHSCPHCQAEIPEVKSWLDATGGVDGVDLVTVSTAANSAAGNWPPSTWLEGEGWDRPIIADDEDSSAFRAFGGSQIPFWVFVDADGNVTRRNVGRMAIAGVEAAMIESVGG